MGDEKRTRIKDLWPFAVVVVGVLLLSAAKYLEIQHGIAKAEKHINLAITTGKMCSSCHFGTSFVNLFNNKTVIENDNVVFYILDEVKVKRW